MPTRRQDADSRTFRQDAYSSSPEFDRGIRGNLVAARAQLLSDPEEIAILWWLQKSSWREGELERIAGELIDTCRSEFIPDEVAEGGHRPGQQVCAEVVRKVRRSLSGEFYLCGDRFDYRGSPLAELIDEDGRRSDFSESESRRFPTSCPFEEIQEASIPEAGDVAECLRRLLVDPSIQIDKVLPNHPDSVRALRNAKDRDAMGALASIEETAVTRQVFEELDFAFESRSFVLIEGREGIGKSRAAKAWVAAHPGKALYVAVESGTDEHSFFRSIAREIGTAYSSGRKSGEIRDRIQDALQPGHLLLVLDEAHYLWPQSARCERGAPRRIEWVRTALVDAGVPVALISTPQHFETQCSKFRKGGWNVNQIRRRLARISRLPEELDEHDLMAVARRHFPEAPKALLLRIAAAAYGSHGYLGTIENLSKRVGFLSERLRSGDMDSIVAKALREIAPETAPKVDRCKDHVKPLQRRSVRNSAGGPEATIEIANRVTAEFSI